MPMAVSKHSVQVGQNWLLKRDPAMDGKKHSRGDFFTPLVLKFTDDSEGLDPFWSWVSAHP
jgi:hypothetical protein